MKKIVSVMMAAVIAAGALTGCAKAGKNADAAYLKDIKLTDYVKLGEYKGLSIEVASPEVTDEEVEQYMQYISSSMKATVEVTDRAVQEGDTVNIDYSGKRADTGEVFDGGTAEGYDLTIGSHSFIDGFEDGLIGAQIGETRDLNLTFPENYGAAELAGADVIFTVKVNSIKVKPDLDDAYAASLGIENVSTIDELKAYLKSRLLEEKQTDYQNEVNNKILEAVTNNCKFSETPAAALERFKGLYTDQANLVASYYSANYGTNYSTDQVLSMLMSQDGFTGEQEEYLADKSVELANQFIMLGAIAEAEGIEVTEDELNEKLNTDMANANATAEEGKSVASLDEYKKTVDVENVKENLLTNKVIEFLAANAVVTEPTADATEADSSAETDEAAQTDAAEEAESAD
ncbi:MULTISPECIES: trigger factor [unclassified Butyrivibrio]|uniref:trigger factor n=1 Tax=unclassified Butyrivibrio TaxID=2639466 RepID=UPI0003B7A7B7|nr:MULTISPECIES: trigger factor [unclassified Butyrivibrio]SEK89836.1 trigger factor [Butyrivibrio sp. ob235]